MNWSLLDGELHFGEWDGDELAVVYNALSGNTHLVQALCLELLQMIQAGTRSDEALTAELARAFPDVESATISENVTAALQQLQRAGLAASTST